MTKVKGPNGIVFNFPADVADGLLQSDDYALVKETPVVKAQPKAEPKSSK